MVKYHYATIDNAHNARVLSVFNQNLVTIIKESKLVVVHPCKTYAEAVKIVEAWKGEANAK